MYAVIWVSFLQILFAVLSPVNDALTFTIHFPTGLAILILAFYVSRKVEVTPCPTRIKRITKTTRNLALLQGLLGVVFSLGMYFGWGSPYHYAVAFLHVATALAIITQASSSATAYDMWEEKEFQVSPA